MEKHKLKVLFSFLVFIYTLGILLIADASLGYNVIPISKPFNKVAFAISPQGWGFFTRNPRESVIDLYAMRENKYHKVIKANASLQYFWGFNRGMRFSSAQMGYFVSQIPKDKWTADDSYNLDSLIQTLTPHEVINDFSQPVHCGKYILTQTERVPWAWSKHRENIKMPRSIVVIDVKCSTNE